MNENFKKYLVEFIGTFFLMFTVGSAVALGANGIIAAVGIGFVLMVMVYAGGYVSGGHYNPAVSFAAFLSGALDKKELLPYWLSQLAGSVLAVYFVYCALQCCLVTSCPYTAVEIFIGEFLFTFALCYVVLQTAVAEKSAGNGYYGLAIGSTVTVGAFAVGGIICYGAFNPAVALGLGLLHASCASCIILTILTNLLAAIAAAYTYKVINRK